MVCSVSLRELKRTPPSGYDNERLYGIYVGLLIAAEELLTQFVFRRGGQRAPRRND